MISDQIALHSAQLPLLIIKVKKKLSRPGKEFKNSEKGLFKMSKTSD